MAVIHDRDRGYAKVKKRFADAQRRPMAVMVGFTSDEVHAGSGLPIGELAAIHEFGTERIPARAPLRTTYDAHASKYQKMLRDIASDLTDPNADMNMTLALQAVGSEYQDDVKDVILRGLQPDLAPSTAHRHPTGVPLVNTGELLEKIGVVVGPPPSEGPEL